MDYKAIKDQAKVQNVPFKWALEQRRSFVNAQLEHYRYKIRCEHEQSLESHLEKRLRAKHIETYVKQVKYWEWQLTKLNPDYNKSGKHIDRETIAAAKAYPIGNLLPEPPRKYMVKCPFHADSIPSGYIRGNFLYCFSCQKGWDTIELLMDLHGLTFRDAVMELAGRR